MTILDAGIEINQTFEYDMEMKQLTSKAGGQGVQSYPCKFKLYYAPYIETSHDPNFVYENEDSH